MTMEKFHWTFKVPYGEGEARPEGSDEFKSVSIAVQRFDNVPFGTIRKLRNLTIAEQFFQLIEKVFSEKDFEKLDALPQGEVRKFMEAWQTDSGVTTGESSAS